MNDHAERHFHVCVAAINSNRAKMGKGNVWEDRHEIIIQCQMELHLR